MDDTFWIALGTALGLMLVLEGLCYSLFPKAMRRVLESALGLPHHMLRRVGLAALAAGVLIVWLIRG